MPNSQPRDTFVYPFHKLMKDLIILLTSGVSAYLWYGNMNLPAGKVSERTRGLLSLCLLKFRVNAKFRQDEPSAYQLLQKAKLSLDFYILFYDNYYRRGLA